MLVHYNSERLEHLHPYHQSAAVHQHGPQHLLRMTVRLQRKVHDELDLETRTQLKPTPSLSPFKSMYLGHTHIRKAKQKKRKGG
jgi:hypothetical protein